jgi:hypothetical protein
MFVLISRRFAILNVLMILWGLFITINHGYLQCKSAYTCLIFLLAKHSNWLLWGVIQVWWIGFMNGNVKWWIWSLITSLNCERMRRFWGFVPWRLAINKLVTFYRQCTIWWIWIYSRLFIINNYSWWWKYWYWNLTHLKIPSIRLNIPFYILGWLIVRHKNFRMVFKKPSKYMKYK